MTAAVQQQSAACIVPGIMCLHYAAAGDGQLQHHLALAVSGPDAVVIACSLLMSVPFAVGYPLMTCWVLLRCC